MLRRVLLALCALALASVQAHAQLLPGRAPGFRPGFQFIGGTGGFPAPGAVIDYDFRNDRYSGPPISVSRASPAYIDDSAGNWTLVPANTLRRSDKGALIEGAQTNQFSHSTDFSQSYWGKSNANVSVSPTNGPFGDATYRVSDAVTGAASIVGISSGFQTVASGGLYTAWFLVKPVNKTWIRITIAGAYSGGTNRAAWFNLSGAGTLGSKESAYANTYISRYANGWYLCAYSFVAEVASTTVTAQLRVADSDNLGNSTATTGSPNFDVAHAQWEAWPSSVTTVGGASSPIRTTGGAATRAADVVTASGIPAAANGNDLTFALVAQSSLTGAYAQFGTYMELGNSPSSPGNRLQLRNNSQANSLIAITNRNDAQAATFPAVGLAPVSSIFAASAALNITTGDAALSQNGSNVVTVTNDKPPIGALTTLFIGHSFSSQQPFAYIRRLAIWPYRAANSNLQTYSTLQNWGG